MSKEELSSTSTPEKRRATVPEIIKHQDSFEHRYKNIIQKQILETSINMDVLHRQMNAFLSFSKSPPKSLDCEATQSVGETVKAAAETSGENKEERTESQSEGTSSEDNQEGVSKNSKEKYAEKIFQKAVTVDIAERGSAEKN